jgi:hypothetical protein
MGGNRQKGDNRDHRDRDVRGGDSGARRQTWNEILDERRRGRYRGGCVPELVRVERNHAGACVR